MINLDENWKWKYFQHLYYRLKDGSWACHHCVDHYGDKTIKEWDEMVKQHNKILYQNLRKMGYINESSKK